MLFVLRYKVKYVLCFKLNFIFLLFYNLTMNNVNIFYVKIGNDMVLIYICFEILFILLRKKTQQNFK